MAVVISAAMAPNRTPSLFLHGSSRLSRASSGAIPPSPSPPPPPPPALAKKDAQDPLFTEEEFQALMSGQCELLSFSESENDLRSPSSPSPSPLLSLQMQAQLLCRDDDARFQETTPFASDDLDLEAPVSDEDIQRLAPMFCDEEIQALCAAPQQAPSMQFSRPRSDDQQAGKKRMSSPPWPSCVADDDDEEAARPPPRAPPSPTMKARTQTKSRSSRELPFPPPPVKKARTQTKTRGRPDHAAVRAARLRHSLRKWHNKIANRILTRQFRPPELSRGRTALRCQCPELALLAEAADDGPRSGGFVVGCCALHQDVCPRDRIWMCSAHQSQIPLVGGPGEVLVPKASAGSSRAMVRKYARWRRSVSLPTRFYVERAVEKRLAQQPDDDDDDWMMA